MSVEHLLSSKGYKFPINAPFTLKENKWMGKKNPHFGKFPRPGLNSFCALMCGFRRTKAKQNAYETKAGIKKLLLGHNAASQITVTLDISFHSLSGQQKDLLSIRQRGRVVNNRGVIMHVLLSVQ